MKWAELNDDERTELIRTHVLDGQMSQRYSEISKYALIEVVILLMEAKDCPFIQVIWMHPRRNPGVKQFGAQFWCKKLDTEASAFADNPADAILEAAVLASLGRLSL